MATDTNGAIGSASFIASRDLANEKLITFCLILSVIAVLAPLMLLASVKVGFIDRLRSEFIDDPSFREVRPINPDLRQKAAIEEFGTWDNVAFVVPSVMLVPREVDFVVPATEKKGEARLAPSGPRDPLFAKLEGTPAVGDNVVLTADVAERAGLKIGSDLTLKVSRIERDRRKVVQLPVKVSGIIPSEVLPQPTILADPAIDRQVESYRAGISVPERGWPGIAMPPRQAYQRLLIRSSEPLGDTVLSDLRIRVGATTLDPVEFDSVSALFGSGFERLLAPEAKNDSFYVLANSGRFYSGADLDEARAVLANSKAKAIGVGAPIEARIDGKAVSVAGLDPDLFTGLGANPGWSGRSDAPFALNNTIFLPEALFSGQSGAGLIDVEIAPKEDWVGEPLTLSLKPIGTIDAPSVVVSPVLLGMLHRGAAVPLAYDGVNGNIVEQSAGFRGFRLLASDIDSVPGIVDRFEQINLPVRAKSDEIRKLQQLERSLDTLILVVAGVALAGGYAILSSSFFANVQRKRVDFATIRLIGMRKSTVFLIPIVQALIVGVLGVLGSIVIYFLVSRFLNTVIGPQLGFDGQLSKLYLFHFVFSALFVLVGSCLASLAASREATRIDPAQAIRSA